MKKQPQTKTIFKEQLENRNILLGIDPSASNFGICIYDPETKQMLLKTAEFTNGLKWIGENCQLNNVIAFVENPNLDSPIFKMWFMVEKEIIDVIHNILFKSFKHGLVKKFVYNILLFSGFTKKESYRNIDGLILNHKGVPKTISDIQSKVSIAMKFASSVGENRANAKLIIKMLAQRNVPVIEIAPSKRQRADKAQQKAGKGKIDMRSLKMPTKTSAGQFQELTGYDLRCNEHNRDAATLVFGRTLRQVRMLATGVWEKESKQPPSYPKQNNDNQFFISKDEEIGLIDQNATFKPE